MVKLGFNVVFIIFLVPLYSIDCGYWLELENYCNHLKIVIFIAIKSAVYCTAPSG